MGKSGIEYITSKEGIVRIIILVLGCLAFALFAAGGRGGSFSGVGGWILAAYIISWCLSLFSFFFIVTTLASQMQCGVAYEAVDVCITVFSFLHCTMASIILAMYTPSDFDEWIAACVFGFFVSVAYAVEGYLNQGDAPESLKYLWTKNGILKVVICIFGCTTFALLDYGGYSCPLNDVDSGRTWAFAAYIISWTVTLIFLLIHVIGVADMISILPTLEFAWSAFSCLHYLVASIVLSCYIDCGPTFSGRAHDARIAAAVFGFITAILYLVEAILLKGGAKGVSPKPTDVKT